MRSYWKSLAVKLAIVHICALAGSFVLFITLMNLPILDSIDVFFYRGVILIVISSLAIGLIIMLLRRRLRYLIVRDAFLTVCLAVSINMLFFTHVPVTAERSISVFMLGYMDEHPERQFEINEIRDFFIETYVEDFGCFEKRMHEQTAINTIHEENDMYSITDKGRQLIKMYDMVCNLFNIDKKIVHPERAK